MTMSASLWANADLEITAMPRHYQHSSVGVAVTLRTDGGVITLHAVSIEDFESKLLAALADAKRFGECAGDDVPKHLG